MPDPHAQPFADGIAAAHKARDAQHALFERHRAGYDAYFTPPLNRLAEAERDRLSPESALAVRAVEEGAARTAEVRDALPGIRDACLVAKAAALGAQARDPGLPPWAACLRDLAALREWRRTELDRIDFDLAPLFLRGKLARGAKAALFDRIVSSWAKGASADPDAVQARLVALAAAGLAPAVDPDAEPGLRDVGALAPGADREAVLAEVEAAYAIPTEGVAVPPGEVIDALRGQVSAPTP